MSFLKKPHKVSVIMGVYNCASTLSEAIDSLLDQTFTDWELIMCDDGSMDNTVDIAQSYASNYDNILFIRNESNLGLPATLNHCLEYADSEYIARMDGDDISLPERFEKETMFLDQHPEYALVSCSMICFDENGDWGIQGNKARPQKIDFAYLSPFCHAPCMMRRKYLNEVGNYTVRKSLLRGQDYYLWHKFYRAGYKGFNLQEPLYKMRDGRNAAKRRSLLSSINGCRNHIEVMWNLKLPIWLYYRAFRGILVSLLPLPLYLKLHKSKVNSQTEKFLDHGAQNKIKVLHIIGSLSKGGIESFILNVYRSIDRTKIQFDFLVNTKLEWVGEYADEIKGMGGNIYEYPFSIKGLRKYKKLLRTNNYIAVHCHRGIISPIFLSIAQKAGVKKRISHSHSIHADSLLKTVFKHFLCSRIPKYATDLLACGEEAGKWLYGNNSFTILYNGVRAKNFTYSVEKEIFTRDLLGINQSQLVFGHVGRIEKPKNHSFLIDVFERISKKNPNSLLLIIGEGSLKRNMEQYANNKNLVDQIRFLGNRSDVNLLLQCVDCIIFPSFYEAFSVAMVEMQAASVPILASNNIPSEIAVIPELVKFKPLDSSIEEWADEAIKFASDNVKMNRYNDISKAGLDISTTVNKLLEIYQGE